MSQHFFPGATEKFCVKIIEKISKLKGITSSNQKKGFYFGYSPERINPGDKKHGIKDIIKITSGSNKFASKYIDQIYKNL